MSLLLRLDVPEAKSRLLDQAGPQAPGHRVEGAAGAGHPAADDEDVQLFAGPASRSMADWR
jgi:hypothetical protein